MCLSWEIHSIAQNSITCVIAHQHLNMYIYGVHHTIRTRIPLKRRALNNLFIFMHTNIYSGNTNIVFPTRARTHTHTYRIYLKALNSNRKAILNSIFDASKLIRMCVLKIMNSCINLYKQRKTMYTTHNQPTHQPPSHFLD